MQELVLSIRPTQKNKNIDEILTTVFGMGECIFNKKLSKKYTSLLSDNEKGFVLSMDDDQKYDYYFCSSNNNKYRLVNIIPSKTDIHGIKYEKRVIKVIEAITALIKNKHVIRVISYDSAENLDEIITSKIAREQLEYALSYYPNSYHPNDLNKIDQFIMLLYRYNRKKPNIELLMEHLIKYRKMDVKYVEYIGERIEIGIQVLDAYRKKWFI